MQSNLTAVPLAADLARHGDAPAVLTATTTVSYRELAARVAATAARLGPTRRLVLLAARNDLDSLVAYLAALAGGHPVLLSHDRPDAVDRLVTVYDPDVVIRPGAAGAELTERRPGTAHQLHPELAVLLSTSGSTGAAKLVRLSATNVQANAAAIAQSLGILAEDRAATTLPMAYAYGLSVVNSHLLTGAALVLTDLSVVDPCFWRLVRERRVTSFAGVPYTFDLLDRVGFDEMELPDLRYLTQAGGRLAPDTVRRYAELGRRRGWDLVVMYGQTEATARMAYLPPALAATHPQAIGVPVPGGSFRLAGAPGAAEGELIYSGPNVMLGYAQGPADLAAGRTVTELRTGDLARRLPGDLYEIIGRRSRFVKIAGLRIDLGRVEQLLAEQGVTAAAAGTDEHLVVAVAGGAEQGVADLARRLGVPRAAVEVHAVPELPRLATGKPNYPAVLALTRVAEPGGTEPGGPVAGAAEPGGAMRGGAEPGGTVAAGGAVTGDRARADIRAQVRAVFAEELQCPDVGDDATFVALGGDSLSYVVTSIRLEEVLGHLPPDWHLRTVAELSPSAAPRRRFLAALETSVVLRAVAIVLIVGTHVGLFRWPGTAHVLVAVAGYNFARFQLAGHRWPRLRRQLRSLARLVVPSVVFIAAAHLLTGDYGLVNILLLGVVLGSETWSTQWHFWFIEVLVYLLLTMTVLLAVPWVDRAERRWPFAVPAVLLGVGLLGRFELVDLGLVHTKPVLWLFALGWALARARGHARRLALSAVAIGAVPGFFGDPRRDAVILAGVLTLAWLPTLPVPAALHRLTGVLASASLYVYLTQWLVYPVLLPVHPAVALVGSLASGVGYWALVTRAPAAARRWRARSARTEPVEGAEGRPAERRPGAPAARSGGAAPAARSGAAAPAARSGGAAAPAAPRPEAPPVSVRAGSLR